MFDKFGIFDSAEELNRAATSRGKASSGKNGLSVARGNGVLVKGGLGAILVIAEEKKDSYDIENWKAVVVDGDKIKPDTCYKMVDGELVATGTVM